jgi:hypothetical protein
MKIHILQATQFYFFKLTNFKILHMFLNLMVWLKHRKGQNLCAVFDERILDCLMISTDAIR